MAANARLRVAGLETLLEEKQIDKAFGIYCGQNRMKQGQVHIWPFKQLLEAIHSGEISLD